MQSGARHSTHAFAYQPWTGRRTCTTFRKMIIVNLFILSAKAGFLPGSKSAMYSSSDLPRTLYHQCCFPRFHLQSDFDKLHSRVRYVVSCCVGWPCLFWSERDVNNWRLDMRSWFNGHEHLIGQPPSTSNVSDVCKLRSAISLMSFEYAKFFSS